MTKDLTKGKIMPLLVGFTIPLVLGNLFQLTYNAVDSIIVGQFVGKEALAAVGICNPVMTLMILFLNGLCMGASILMGTQYGAKDYDKLHRQISTTMLSGVVLFYIKCAVYSACHTYTAYFTGRFFYYEAHNIIYAHYIYRTCIYISVQLLLKHTKGAW